MQKPESRFQIPDSRLGAGGEVADYRLQNTGRMVREEWRGEIIDTDFQTPGRAGRDSSRKAESIFQNTGFNR